MQNAAKAPPARRSDGTWYSRSAKIRAASTTRFLVHWCGRRDMKSCFSLRTRYTTVSSYSTFLEARRLACFDPSVQKLLFETLDGFLLGIVRLEDREELCDREQIVNPLRQVQQLELTVLAAHGGVAANDLPQAGAVHVGNIRQIQDDSLGPVLDQLIDLLAQQLVTLSDQHLSLQIQNGDAVHCSFINFHRYEFLLDTGTYQA